jgi:predicted NAD-dependent protein-ADP-ribosyltransferase YbiA (DUF1768 family)
MKTYWMLRTACCPDKKQHTRFFSISPVETEIKPPYFYDVVSDTSVCFFDTFEDAEESIKGKELESCEKYVSGRVCFDFVPDASK